MVLIEVYRIEHKTIKLVLHIIQTTWISIVLNSECHILKEELKNKREYSEGNPEWWADGNAWNTVGEKRKEKERKWERERGKIKEAAAA